MPTAYPKEFRDDVLRVVAAREPGVTIKMIAKDFGIHVGTLDKWLREERVESGCVLSSFSRPCCRVFSGQLVIA